MRLLTGARLKALAGLAFSAALIGPASAADEPQRGGTLVWAIVAEPPTYDCHGSQTFATLQRVAPHYSTLLRFAPGNFPNVVPDVAESWTASPDQLTYTFKLRPNVKFHDGTTLTSEDVKATYERIGKPPKGVISNRKDSLAKVAAIETPDPLTVVFRMKEVNASAANEMFASPWNCIYSAARLKQDPNFPVKNVMGTGPFKFVEHIAGSHWTGERFADYFRKDRPYLDGFRSVTVSGTAAPNALGGQQVMAEFRGFSPGERDRIVGLLKENAKVYDAIWLSHIDISINSQKKPFDDPRVRRALSLAIDRWGGGESLGKISNMRYVGGVMLPGGAWAATEEELLKYPGYGRDVEANRAEARRLLKEAGAENLTLVLSNRNIPPYPTLGVFLIDQWRRVGIKAEHQPLETKSWVTAMAQQSFDILVDSYTDYTDDPTTGLVKFLSADRWTTASNKFDDKKLNDLYTAQARTIDKTERRRLIREFEKITLEEANTLPVLWWERIVVHNARVHGWTMSPSHMNYQSLEDVWLSQK
ncbi:MAG: ABC transporter substrate-binding protein [Proteobacteria bacterium]|nr:ABC transporter substrate-binding protein [Pseudomonadota bacterium]